MSNNARSENEAEDNSEMAFSWNLMSFCENMFSKLLKIFSSQPFPAVVDTGQRGVTKLSTAEMRKV